MAALAILLAALAPSLSHAFAANGDAGWVELCSADGRKWVRATVDEKERVPAPAHALEHCPGCSLHAPTLAPPPVSELAVPAAPRGRDLPAACLFAPRTPHAWASAQPRAPPRAC